MSEGEKNFLVSEEKAENVSKETLSDHKKKKRKLGICPRDQTKLNEGETNFSVSEEEAEDDKKQTLPDHKKKKRKPGIIFLPTIPQHMTVTMLREILGEFGELGRVYLQLEDTHGKKKSAKHFSEGWVEFKSKKVAKNVAERLNNARIGGRKKSRFFDITWSMKYLPRFKWVHLNERLAYERAVHKQRLRAEVMMAKREANHFQAKVDRSERIKKYKQKQELQEVMAFEGYAVPQRMLDSEHRAKKPQEKKAERANLMQSLFGK